MHVSPNQNRSLSAVERNAIIEEFWASRNAWADTMNADRRAAWEGKWAGIRERDLSPNHTRPVQVPAQSCVLPLRRNKEEAAGSDLPESVTSAPGYRFYWQPKSLQAPLP
jgi:hypothetical protein